MRVVDAIAQWFEVAGFRHYFGYAGGAVWPFLDALTDKPEIEGIQAKHESHAVHMADIYHRVSGRVAPVIVSKGPGLLNAVGACASAMHESSPVLIIAGGSTTHFLGKAGMQEIFYHGFEDAPEHLPPDLQGHLDAGAAGHHDRDSQLCAEDRDVRPARTGVRRGAVRHPACAGGRRDRSARRALVATQPPARRCAQRRARGADDRRGRAAAAAGGRRRGPRRRGRCTEGRRREAQHPDGDDAARQGNAAGGSPAVDRHARPLGLRLRRARQPRGRSGDRRRRPLLRQPHRQLAQGFDLRRRQDQDRAGRSRLPGGRPQFSGRARSGQRCRPVPRRSGGRRRRARQPQASGLAGAHPGLPRRVGRRDPPAADRHHCADASGAAGARGRPRAAEGRPGVHRHRRRHAIRRGLHEDHRARRLAGQPRHGRNGLGVVRVFRARWWPTAGPPSRWSATAPST